MPGTVAVDFIVTIDGANVNFSNSNCGCETGTLDFQSQLSVE